LLRFDRRCFRMLKLKSCD